MDAKQQQAPAPQADAAAQGNPARPRDIEQLFREHNEALVKFLLTRLRSRQAACEVAQEAYVRLLSLHKPEAVSYLRAFLFTTAANLATDRMRREDIHGRAIELPLFHELEDKRTPERQVAGVQEISRIAALLNDLPPKCREAFILNRFYGMDVPAVAQEMGLKERMVRNYVVRALLYCRGRFDAQGEKP